MSTFESGIVDDLRVSSMHLHLEVLKVRLLSSTQPFIVEMSFIRSPAYITSSLQFERAKGQALNPVEHH